MQVPLQIVFEHLDHSEAIETRIRSEAEKLERYYERITSVRVVVDRPRHRHHKGDTYVVRILIAVPGAEEIAVSRDPSATGRHEDILVTIRDAFDAARRQLQDMTRERGGQHKVHEERPYGTISALNPDRDHGFIASADGREIYFHRNSVADTKLEELQIGQKVTFAESIGDKGPQATFVKPLG